MIATYLNQNYIEVESKIAGKYVLVLDALDGECNLDAAIVSGSSFAIYKRKSYDEQKVTSSDVLRAGKEVCAAGYCLYGNDYWIYHFTG